MEDKNLEGFLKHGKLYNTSWCDNLIKNFVFMLFLVLPQFIAAYVSQNIIQVSVISCVCLVIDIIMLISCKKTKDKLFGNNYCMAKHFATMSIILFADAMLSLYYLVNRKYYAGWIIGMIILYLTGAFGRYFWVSMKIERGWYREHEAENYQVDNKMIKVCGASGILIARPILQVMSEREVIIAFFAGLMILSFVFIKYVDYFMLYYCFTKLSKEEQDYICGKQAKKGRIPQRSVYEVIGKK